ncbi:MAG: class I SAM-dependent methyltransferase [Thaumarchaeota archaeon]|nr:class I SAM-dependent methyltransferase [Nitrososphaerota archaeon]MCL5316646.1 class I SAM-dependent methyltransferase [Nitrososphaerota archaeon]
MPLPHEGYANAKRFFTSANAENYDRVVCITTFGRDSVWKRQIIKLANLDHHHTILELACGTGILSSMLTTAASSNSSTEDRESVTVAGIDLTFEYLLAAKRKAMKEHSRNQQSKRRTSKTPSLVQGTAEVLPYRSNYFDAIVSSYLAKYVDVQQVVDECWRVLKPSGVVVFHDFTYPRSSKMRSLWNTYFAVLRLAGRFADSWRVVFNQLDKVVRESSWVKQTEEALYNSGFQDISCKYCTFSTAAIISAKKNSG